MALLPIFQQVWTLFQVNLKPHPVQAIENNRFFIASSKCLSKMASPLEEFFMALKMRLKRLGRKGRPFYHVVVTDSRNARNGRFIEQIGHYDPNPESSIIEFNVERLSHWYKIGARPSDSVAAMMKAKKINIAALVQG